MLAGHRDEGHRWHWEGHGGPSSAKLVGSPAKVARRCQTVCREAKCPAWSALPMLERLAAELGADGGTGADGRDRDENGDRDDGSAGDDGRAK